MSSQELWLIQSFDVVALYALRCRMLVECAVLVVECEAQSRRAERSGHGRGARRCSRGEQCRDIVA